MNTDKETANLYMTYIREIVSEYVEFPEKLIVEAHYSKPVIRVGISPASEDVGKVIGKGSASFDALATLLASKADFEGDESKLKLVEPERKPYTPKPRFVNTKWGQADNLRMGNLLTRIIDRTFQVNAEVLIKPSAEDTTLTLVPKNGDSFSLEAIGALNTLFRAIGAKNGRKLTVNARH